MSEILHIAILTGGPGDEREISLKSAQLVRKSLKNKRFKTYMIDVDVDGWCDMDSMNKIDLNDFSLEVDGDQIKLNAAYMVIHGTPAEDGKIQAYLDMKGIPYTGSSALACALTFDKNATKKMLVCTDVAMAQSAVVIKDSYIDSEDLIQFQSWTYPVFVKPNKNGSSYGVFKVNEYAELENAVTKAFRFDNEVMVEAYLSGRECSCGVYRNKDGLITALPITEIIPEGEFFNYEAKYKNASQEITPANFTPEITQECQNTTKFIYSYLECDGFARVDYILVGDNFYFLEINTIPGLSPQSMIPQQVVAAGLDIHQFLEDQLKDVLGI